MSFRNVSLSYVMHEDQGQSVGGGGGGGGGRYIQLCGSETQQGK